MSSVTKILAVDPGSYECGYGVLFFENEECIESHYGVWTLSQHKSIEKKLDVLASYLDDVFLQFKPHHFVLEKAFVGKNVKSAFQLAHIRGVCLQKSSHFGAQVSEYNPTQVKKSIVGFGHASKEQVKTLVVNRLGLRNFEEKHDASDALALGLYHYYSMRDKAKFEQRGKVSL